VHSSGSRREVPRRAFRLTPLARAEASGPGRGGGCSHEHGFFAFALLSAQNSGMRARFSFAPPFKDVCVMCSVTRCKRIAFANVHGDRRSGCVRRCFTVRSAGHRRAGSPFWSPDGHSLGFFGGGLKRVDFSGGQSTVLTLRPMTMAATGARCVILHAEVAVPDLSHRASGGAPTRQPAEFARHEITHRYAKFLPDGRHFIYWVWSALEENTGIYAGSLDPKENCLKARWWHWREARYAGARFLLFLQGSRLVASGSTQPVGLTPSHFLYRTCGRHGGPGRAMFSVSPSVCWRPGSVRGRARIVLAGPVREAIRSIGAQGSSDLARPGKDAVGRYRGGRNTLEDLWRWIGTRPSCGDSVTALYAGRLVPGRRRVRVPSNREGVLRSLREECNRRR